MNCNLTNEERKTKEARCRSWNCSACNNFYTNCLNEEIIKLNRQLEIAKKALMNINVDDSALSGKWVSEYELRDIAKQAIEEIESAGE